MNIWIFTAGPSRSQRSSFHGWTNSGWSRGGCSWQRLSHRSAGPLHEAQCKEFATTRWINHYTLCLHIL